MWWEGRRRKSAWVWHPRMKLCCFPERGKLSLGCRERCGWQMKSTRSSGMWGWQQQMNKCVTGCASHAVGFSCSPTLPQTCLEEKKNLIYCRVWLIQLDEGREVLGLGSLSLSQGCVYDLSVNPSPVEPVSEGQKDQEMGFAQSPSTDSSAFHLNAGKHLYPVRTSKEKAFTGVSHPEGIWKQQSERAPGLCKHGPCPGCSRAEKDLGVAAIKAC